MKIGIITYHSAYNFGSMLQAFATQKTINDMFGESEIINYRTAEQKRRYSIFESNSNIKAIIRNVIRLITWSSKCKRAENFESFMRDYMRLTTECMVPNEVCSLWNNFDIIVSGSDQIWNKHSNELENVDWEEMFPYLLNGFSGKKVSYASSPANMSVQELTRIIPYIKQFSSVSFREESTKEFMNSEFGIESTSVLDPTFLLTRDEWIKELNLKSNERSEKYILYYSLKNRQRIKQDLIGIIHYAERINAKIKVIAPLAFGLCGGNRYKVLRDIGPVQFMNLIYNSFAVVTDSYHGTILSVNLQKNIFSICGDNKSEQRKTDILNRIGLSNRVVNNTQEISSVADNRIEYSGVNHSLDVLRQQSKQYLYEALSR